MRKTSAEKTIKAFEEANRNLEEIIAKKSMTIQTLGAQRDRAIEQLAEAYQHKGKAMSLQFDVEKLKKQNLVIGHIAAGRTNEAILEILKPMPVLFTMNVIVADDGSREKAAQEMLDSVKGMVVSHLDNIKIGKEPAPEKEPTK